MSKTFTKSDVASNNKGDSLWIIVDDDVYDLTKFQDDHPGGKKILQRVAGKDASKQFWKYHNEGILKKFQKKLQIGSLDTKPKAAAPPAPTPAPKKEAPKPKPTAAAAPAEEAEALEPFGEQIPFSDPSWYQGHHSPYFNETHAALRAEVREWIETEIEPYVTEWDEKKEVPASVYKEMGRRGYLAGLLGTHYQKDFVQNPIKSVPHEKWDLFHEMLLTDELSRTGSGGFVWNVIGGFGIGCPPLVKFGKKSLVDRILPGILNGDKRICLAITEPDAGSDVANLTCEAKLSADGKHYIVNGEKKWITNGIWADYFTVAVRTGGTGMNGVSLLLIEREAGGVSTRRMDCQGVWSSGTTYITFEDVKVPVENLIGKENQGFRHHDQLQPRAHRYHHPVPALLARLLRGVGQVRQQAPDLWQEAHRTPRHPPQAGPHGPSDRGQLQLARERHLPVREDGRDRGHAASGRAHRLAQGPGHRHL